MRAPGFLCVFTTFANWYIVNLGYPEGTLERITTQLPVDDPVLQTFLDLLRTKLGERLQEVWLFGSRARGDHDDQSDYDVLVIAAGELKNTRAIVADTDYQILTTYNELIGSIVYTPEIWQKSKHGPLGMNVLAEGRQIA
ncbi:MAG: nucleotidyltransferase domain-containing protein [Spirochaetaceae bacterium]|nr:MAG: nucleotidyltransferase domain-containing protein [Spirochaetaceae bacterium]